MDRLREAWNNDVLLSMGSSFCVGLGVGVCTWIFFVQGRWVVLPLGFTSALFWVGMSLLSRADRLRHARWQRRDWR